MAACPLSSKRGTAKPTPGHCASISASHRPWPRRVWEHLRFVSVYSLCLLAHVSCGGRLFLRGNSSGHLLCVQVQQRPGRPCPQGTCVLGTALPGPWRTPWFQGNIRGSGCCRGHVASWSRAPETEAAVLTSQSCCLSCVLGPVRPKRGSRNLHGSCLF